MGKVGSSCNIPVLRQEVLRHREAVRVIGEGMMVLLIRVLVGLMKDSVKGINGYGAMNWENFRPRPYNNYR
jgi:hypothetical protein